MAADFKISIAGRISLFVRPYRLLHGHLVASAAYSLASNDNSRRVMRRDTVIGWNVFPLAVLTPLELRHWAMAAKDVQPSYKHALM